MGSHCTRSILQGPLGLTHSNDGMKVRMRWQGHPEWEDSEAPLRNVYEGVPELLKKYSTTITHLHILPKQYDNLLASREESVTCKSQQNVGPTFEL